MAGSEGFNECRVHTVAEFGVYSGCGDGSGAGASSAGTSTLGITLVSRTISVCLVSTVALEVYGITWSCVTAGSWLLRGDRDGVVSAL